MAPVCCKTCGRRLPTPKPAAVVDLAAMNETERRAHFRKTAPLEDVRFWIRYAVLPAGLLAKFDELESQILHGLGRTETYARLAELQAEWRRESNARDVQAHTDAGEILIGGFWTKAADVVVVAVTTPEPIKLPLTELALEREIDSPGRIHA